MGACLAAEYGVALVALVVLAMCCSMPRSRKALAAKEVECKAVSQKELAEESLQDPTSSRSLYDYIVMTSSLSALTQGNQFDILQSARTELNIDSAVELRIIAVVGLFDKGKTFLINELFDKSLRSSKIYSTQGLSFLYVPSRKMLIVDTAGIQSTVSFRPQDVEPIVDAQTTEAFIFELISRLSDLLIFVVNDFTWLEQKYVAMFHQKDKLHQKSRELIVIHNLRTTSKEQEAKALFEKQIKSQYEGVESHMSELVYTADSTPAVHHITLCQKGSAAGAKYNEKNCYHLMNVLEYNQGGRTRVVLSDLLTAHIAEMLPKFLLIEPVGSPWKLDYDGAAAMGAISETSGAAIEGYVQAGAIVAKNCKLTMKTQGVISEFGEVVAYDASFNPQWNMFEEATANEIIRTIQIECPGVTEEDILVDDTCTGIMVTIEKRKTIDEASVQPLRPIIERSGTFRQTIPIQDRQFQLRQDEVSLAHGILKIKLRKPLGVQRRLRLSKSDDIQHFVETDRPRDSETHVEQQYAEHEHESASVVAQQRESAPGLAQQHESATLVAQQHESVQEPSPQQMGAIGDAEQHGSESDQALTLPDLGHRADHDTSSTVDSNLVFVHGDDASPQ